MCKLPNKSNRSASQSPIPSPWYPWRRQVLSQWRTASCRTNPSKLRRRKWIASWPKCDRNVNKCATVVVSLSLSRSCCFPVREWWPTDDTLDVLQCFKASNDLFNHINDVIYRFYFNSSLTIIKTKCKFLKKTSSQSQDIEMEMSRSLTPKRFCFPVKIQHSGVNWNFTQFCGAN